LSERGSHTCSEFHLATQNGDSSVRLDRDPIIQRVSLDKGTGSVLY